MHNSTHKYRASKAPSGKQLTKGSRRHNSLERARHNLQRGDNAKDITIEGDGFDAIKAVFVAMS